MIGRTRAFLASRAGFVSVFALCTAASIAPLLVTEILPLHDLAGILGLSGALVHEGEPAARIHEHFFIDVRPYPSSLVFAWVWLGAQLGASAAGALSAFFAIFAVAGPPLALLLVLRAFGRPRELALLAFPVSWHHQIWFGFVASAAAITGTLAALAFAKRAVDAEGRRAWSSLLGLAAALTFVASLHPFSLALTLAVVMPLLFVPPAGARPARAAASVATRLACLVPPALFLASWAGGFFGGTRGRPLLSTLRAEVRFHLPAPADAGVFLRWLGDGYRGAADEIVPAAALLMLVAFLARGVRDDAPADRDSADRDEAPWWRREGPLAWALGALALGFLTLPMKLFWPNYWWGVRVRFVAPLFFVAIAAVRPSRRGLPRAWLAAPVVVAVVWMAVVTTDFATHWKARALDGFAACLAHVPPGRALLALMAPETRYTQDHPYLVQHYVARTGGLAVPVMHGHPGSYWAVPKPPPDAPAWGAQDVFSWAEHGAGYDHFLVEAHADGTFRDPLEAAPPGAVDRIAAFGRWRLYRKRDTE